MENWKRDDGLEPLLPHLVEQCFKTGIPEEEAVQRTLMHYFTQRTQKPSVQLLATDTGK